MSERTVGLGIGAHTVVQDTAVYSFTQDSVLCANLAKAGTKDRVLDLGCGCGIIGILLLLKKNVREVVGLDINPSAVVLTRRNAASNGLAERLYAVEGDAADAAALLGYGAFDKAVCNPPYYAFDDGSGVYDVSKREGASPLENFVKGGAECLRNGGDFTLVHKADRLCDAVTLFRKYGLEPKTATLIYPRAEGRADIFVMTARKGGKTGLIVDAVVLAKEDGSSGDRIREIYGNG